MNTNPFSLINETDIYAHIVRADQMWVGGVELDPTYMNTGPTCDVSETITTAPGTAAEVVNVGDAKHAMLQFHIPQGVAGVPGQSSTVTVGTTNTLPAGSTCYVSNSGTASAAILNFGLARGADSTIAVKQTITAAPGTSASVVNEGSPSAAQLVFTVPQGIQGPATTVQVGTVTALPPTATPTVTGVADAAHNTLTLNFGLVSGATGARGADGAVGATGGIAYGYKGMWQPYVPFSLNDVVLWAEDQVMPRFNSYVCVKAHSGNPPQTPPSPYAALPGEYWALLAQCGNDGGRGPAGKDGSSVDITDVLTGLLTLAAWTDLKKDVAGLGGAVAGLQGEVGTLQTEMVAMDESLATTAAKVVYQGASTATLSTTFGGTSLTKLAADGTAAVTLNASGASVFKAGVDVKGKVSADSLALTGGFTAPGIDFDPVNNTYTFGKALDPSTKTYIYGQLFTPHHNMLDTWGFIKTADGYLSQF